MDGDSFIKDMRVPEVLDNLLAAHRIPPMVAVFVYSAPGARARELQGNSIYTDFLALELAPWVRHNYNVTSDPRRVLIGGIGYGAMTGAYAALRHSDVFGNVLAESGSFDWTPVGNSPKQPESDFPPEPVWIANQFLETPRLPIRFFLSSGLDEVDISGYGGPGPIADRGDCSGLRPGGHSDPVRTAIVRFILCQDARGPSTR